jgi:hypothetical protein
LGAALIALASPAKAQQMTYDQWVGPSVAPTEDNIDVTWAGQTQYGYTVYLHNNTTGVNGVMWQATPTSPWRFKGSNGNTATATADLSDWQDTTPRAAPQYVAPRPAPRQQYIAPQPQYNQGYAQAAYVLRMFGCLAYGCR